MITEHSGSRNLLKKIKLEFLIIQLLKADQFGENCALINSRKGITGN
jgi:hypothetical protein